MVLHRQAGKNRCDPSNRCSSCCFRTVELFPASFFRFPADFPEHNGHLWRQKTVQHISEPPVQGPNLVDCRGFPLILCLSQTVLKVRTRQKTKQKNTTIVGCLALGSVAVGCLFFCECGNLAVWNDQHRHIHSESSLKRLGELGTSHGRNEKCVGH